MKRGVLVITIAAVSTMGGVATTLMWGVLALVFPEFVYGEGAARFADGGRRFYDRAPPGEELAAMLGFLATCLLLVVIFGRRLFSCRTCPRLDGKEPVGEPRGGLEAQEDS